MKKSKKCEDKGSVTEGAATDITENVTPESVNPSPETKPVESKDGVVKRGVELEFVDSPRFGESGQSTPTRGSAGGGAYNPSGQVDRSPANPNVRGPGSDPMNKIDIRDESDWNEMGAVTLRTVIDGSPAGFEAADVLGNFTYKDNLAFQFDNIGIRPGFAGKPYRRRITSIGKDMLFFSAGQHDLGENGTRGLVYGGTTMQFYPSKTWDNAAARSEIDIPGGLQYAAYRSNFLTRGMLVTIARSSASNPFRIVKVEFDSVELPCSSTSNDLDVRQDNARVYWDVANKLITQDYFDMVNNPSNIADNKYSPIPDGQPNAMQHLLLAEDIAAADGAIAFAFMRSAAECYAYHRALRHDYGSGDGAKAQARAMLAPDLISDGDTYNIYADNADRPGSGYYKTAVSSHMGGVEHNAVRLTMPEYIMTNLDSPGKYNDTIGVWLTLPRGLRILYEEAQKSFDSAEFLIDKDTYALMDNVVGWHTSHDRRIGVSKFGLITPFDYNRLYKDASDSHVPTIQASGRLESKYIIVDYTLAGNYYNHTELRSPLIDAMLRAISNRVIPKLKGKSGNNSTTYEIYVPFSFDCEKLNYGHAVFMEAVPFVHEYNHLARAAFDRFETLYGVNPIKTDLIQELKLADVYKGSCYKGLGADAVMPEASPFLKLMFMDPEDYDLSCRVWRRGIEFANAVVGVTFNDFGPISDSIIEPQKMLFPMKYPGMTLEQFDDMFELGAHKYLRSRDLPIHRYCLTDSSEKFSREVGDVSAFTQYDASTPFFEYQKPQVYFTDNVGNNALALSIKDVLCAPRVNGRMTPAPRGMLDFVMCNTSSHNPKASRAFKLDDAENTYRYGWRVTPGTSIVFATDSADNVISFGYASSKLQYEGYDIDNYRVTFVYADPFDLTVLGQQLKRYMVHVCSGNLTTSELGQLVNTYHMYLSPDQSLQFDMVGGVRKTGDTKAITIAASGTKYCDLDYQKVTVGDGTTVYDLDPNSDHYVGTTVTTLSVAVGTGVHAGDWDITNSDVASVTIHVMKDTMELPMGYINPTLIMWTMDYLYPFVHSPFQGVAKAALGVGDVYYDDNLDVGLMAMFGMAGFQGIWYDRLNLRVYAAKQEAGGRIYDNRFLHEDNILFV